METLLWGWCFPRLGELGLGLVPDAERMEWSGEAAYEGQDNPHFTLSLLRPFEMQYHGERADLLDFVSHLDAAAPTEIYRRLEAAYRLEVAGGPRLPLRAALFRKEESTRALAEALRIDKAHEQLRAVARVLASAGLRTGPFKLTTRLPAALGLPETEVTATFDAALLEPLGLELEAGALEALRGVVR